MKRIKTIVFVLLFLGLAGGCGKTGTGENAADTEWSEVETGTSDRIEIVDEDAVSGDNIRIIHVKHIVGIFLQKDLRLIPCIRTALIFYDHDHIFLSVSIVIRKGHRAHFHEIIRSWKTAFRERINDAAAFHQYKMRFAFVIRRRGRDKQYVEAEVFLQENSDNMFYMDYPDMADYRIDAQTKEGPAFYRDTFLEEYLHTQRLTDTVSDITGTWADYDSYVGSLVYGYIDIDRQIELLAEYRDMWAGSVEYADDVYCFTVTDLDYDGSLEVITSNMGGTGFYSDNRFYELDREGNLRELETSFTEGSSQPDLIFDPADTQDQRQMTLYSSFTPEGIRDYYIVRDWCKVSPDCYVERTSSLCMMNDYILETPLATQVYTYEGEDYTEHVVSEDCSGNALTEEEYDNFADTYYSNMGLEKKTASFLWISMSELEGKSDEEAAELIRQAEQGFVR